LALSKLPCPGCGGSLHRTCKLCRHCELERRRRAITPPIQPVQHAVDTDRATRRSAAELASLKSRYDEALKTITQQEHELRALNVLAQGRETFEITPKHSSHTSEGTVVIVASDWHAEETVGGETGGLNTFNPAIAKTRVERFFQSSLRLLTLLQQDVTIETVVLALLGDFISNDIHEEFGDITNEQPMHALVTAQSYLISGLEFLLAHTTVRFIVPCHSGNHARTTRTTRFAAENGHSLEYLLYLHLAAYFRTEPRLTFLIPEGMHSYLNVYGTTIRFHHGHAIRYAGGVGGIYIPVNKAIANWNTGRHADLDVFGHFHQMRDGGNFIANGSLIGYNAFALSIKAPFERPKQALFLIDKKRGRTCTWQIHLED
jgi:hypothetical protein